MLLSVLIRPPKAVSVTREVSPAVCVGRRFEVKYVVGNNSPYALQIEFRDVLPAELWREGEEVCSVNLRGGQEAVFEQRIVPLSRGKHKAGPSTLSASFPWSLIAFVETLDNESEVTVYPGRPSGETEQLIARSATMAEQGKRRLRLRGQDQEFDCLSDYVPGDDVRHIDWKASSRRMKPQTRRYRMERNANVVYALDCGRLMGTMSGGIRKLDLAITPLLDLAAVSLQRGDRAGLVAFSSSVSGFVPCRSGIRHLSRLQRALGELDADFEHTSYESCAVFLKEKHPRRSLVVLFTDFAEEISARAILANLAVLSRRHMILFVGVSDPHIEEIFFSEPSSGRAVFEKAVASDLITERAELLEEMKRLGVYVVEGDPSRLSARVINAYMEIRLRGLL